MTASAIPAQADANYREVVELIESVEKQKLAAAVPKAFYEPRVVRSLVGFFASYALYAAAVWGLSVVPHWGFYIPLWIAAGLGGWGLHCIAHDAGHGSFSRSKRLNTWVGHLSLLPMIYPFHAWRHVHNMHHAATNSLEQDTDWRPIDWATFKRASLFDQINYATNRTVLFWLGTAAYWLVSGFRPSFFPQSKVRAEVRRSILFVLLASAAYISALWYFTGFTGVLLYFVGPWVAIHVWFSITTLMHHVSEDLPFLSSAHWTRKGGALLTIDYKYPKWLHFFTHNISIHTVHHIAPGIPSYNLPMATDALKEAHPGIVRERDFSFRQLWRIVTRCHLYDPETGYYRSFFEAMSGEGNSAKRTA